MHLCVAPAIIDNKFRFVALLFNIFSCESLQKQRVAISWSYTIMSYAVYNRLTGVLVIVNEHFWLTISTATLRNSKGRCLSYCDVTLPYMSIGARVIRAVALQQINHAPYAKASAESDNEGL